METLEYAGQHLAQNKLSLVDAQGIDGEVGKVSSLHVDGIQDYNLALVEGGEKVSLHVLVGWQEVPWAVENMASELRAEAKGSKAWPSVLGILGTVHTNGKRNGSGSLHKVQLLGYIFFGCLFEYCMHRSIEVCIH